MSETMSVTTRIRGARRARLLVAAVSLILLLEVALAYFLVKLAPEGSAVASYWPNAGLSVVALILTPARWRPATLTGIFMVSLIGSLLGDRDLQASAGLAIANTAEATLASWLLLGRTQADDADSSKGAHLTPSHVIEDPDPFLPDRPRLDTVDDFIRLFVVSAFASMLGGILAGATVGLLVGGDPVATARAVFASHLAAMLLIVPLSMRLPRDPDQGAGWLEMLAQWTTLAIVIVVVFFGTDTLPLVFIVYPVLVWGALRFQPRITALTLLGAGGAVVALASTRGGPYVAALSESGRSPETMGPMLQAHLLATVLVTIPLALLKSQRLHALDDLTSSHEELDAILAATTATAIVGFGPDGRVEYVNVGTERLTGWSADDVVGKAHLTLLDGETASASAGGTIRIGFAFGEAPGAQGPLRDLVDPLLDAAGGTIVQDWVFERADGETLTVSAALSRRYDATGAPSGYLAVAEDVTERRRQERAVQEALASEKLVVDRLAQLDQKKNDFLSTVSHELRTPITSILGYSQLLMGQDTKSMPAVQRQVVSRIERNGRRLMGLIEDMLAMSQIEVGSFEFSRAPLDVRDPLRQAVESTTPLLPARDLTLRQDVAELPVLVAGDADKLERAFTNLLTNAVKFSHPGEEITVSVQATADEAVVSVTDRGVGIDAVDQEQLFERFFRGAVANDLAIQGAGLGLPITAKIVAGHDGHIDIESSPGQGSTFTIRLPLLVEGP